MGPETSAETITPDILLRAYSIGMFPMAETAEDDHIFWLDPHWRGIFPLDGLKLSKNLVKTLRQDRFDITVNTCFARVIEACAQAAPDRATTWINADIKRLYNTLHQRGHAHSVEVWRGGELAGGLYGVSLGAAFFGESMFHRVSDASKVALVHLVARLRRNGFTLLDTQFVTPHLASLGAIEIPRSAYRKMLARAIERSADFMRPFAHTGTNALASLTAAYPDC